MEKIFVTKPYLPPKEEFLRYVDEIYQSCVLTNGGPLSVRLEEGLRAFLGVQRLIYVANGTLALQLAIKALGLSGGEVITTPFSYVATVTSLLWEGCTPVFVDIEPDNFTLDPDKIEEKITPATRAIMPVHVFGYACQVDRIEEIARRHGLKVIYDAAHAFGSVYRGRSLCSYGDASAISFHATKLFHTVEGGACLVQDGEAFKTAELMRRFGHDYDEYILPGINAKQDEFNAAMGLCNLGHMGEIIRERRRLSGLYDSLLPGQLRRPKPQEGLGYNYGYYPVIFDSEAGLLAAFGRLAKINVHPRRYFWPALNKLPYLKKYEPCPVAEDIASRVACLPLFVGLEKEAVERICAAL